MRGYDADYEAWENSVPSELKDDPLWTVRAYRLALFAADAAWPDVTKLFRDGRTRSLSDQLFRAVGSISANTSEGYSRSSSRDRTRIYEFALGSARECRGWYWKGRHVLGDDLVKARIELLTDIIRLLLRMVSDQRGWTIKEERADCVVNAETPSE